MPAADRSSFLRRSHQLYQSLDARLILSLRKYSGIRLISIEDHGRNTGALLYLSLDFLLYEVHELTAPVGMIDNPIQSIFFDHTAYLVHAKFQISVGIMLCISLHQSVQII